MHFAWTKEPIFLLNVMPLLGLGFSYGGKWLVIIHSGLASIDMVVARFS